MALVTTICLRLPSQLPCKAGFLNLNCLLEMALDLCWLPHCAQKYFEGKDRQLWDTWHSVVYLYRWSLTHSVTVVIKAELGWKTKRSKLGQKENGEKQKGRLIWGWDWKPEREMEDGKNWDCMRSGGGTAMESAKWNKGMRKDGKEMLLMRKG